jgi:hypothetical protein
MTTRQPLELAEDAPLEPVAGELCAALAQQSEPAADLPAGLAARIVAEGERQLGAGPIAPLERRDGLGDRGVVPIGTWRARPASRLGWLVAAAAIIAWLLVPSPIVPRRDGAAPIAAATLRDSLLTDSASLRVKWAASTDPAGAGASGDVVWSGRSQRGVLRFSGLAPNDPRSAQYQLWIVDAERDARYPVDGGVFDVGASGEVLVPVTARLPVVRPTLFAVTLERPGGVVVSTRERLVLAAPVGG